MASPSPNPNRIRIPSESMTHAIAALLKWIQSQPKQQKSQLFEHDELLYLILTLKRIPSKVQSRINPYRITLPHPLHPFDPQSTSICLLANDSTSSLLDQIRTHNLPISSVIGLSDLRSDYRPFESRRKLCDSYDLFFADRKIIPLLPRILGKHFFKRKKIPLAVDLSRPGWPEQIERACGSTLLYLRTGTCSGLKIGRVNQDVDEIVENAVAAIEGAIEHVPRKWGNLRSVHVKTVDSVALPIYQAVPEMGLKIEGVRRKKKDKGEIFMKEKKRMRAEEESKVVAKKGRIHEVGYLDGDGEVRTEEEVVGEEVSVEKRVKKRMQKEKAGEALGREEKKRKKGLEILEEEDGDDDVVLNGYEEEEKRGEVEVEEAKKKKEAEKKKKEAKKKKKKGTKDGKVKGKKAGGNEDDYVREENGSEELSAKKMIKKMKMAEDVVVASVLMKKKKSKPKNLEGDVVKKTKSKVSHEID